MALEVKSPSTSAGDTRDAGSIPEWGRSPAVANGTPLQSSCLENSMGREAWWATVHQDSQAHKESDTAEQSPAQRKDRRGKEAEIGITLP